MSHRLKAYQRKRILPLSVMSITSAIAAIYAEKMVTPKMEAFLNRVIKSRRLTYPERYSLKRLAQKIESGEILVLSTL